MAFIIVHWEIPSELECVNKSEIHVNTFQLDKTQKITSKQWC